MIATIEFVNACAWQSNLKLSNKKTTTEALETPCAHHVEFCDKRVHIYRCQDAVHVQVHLQIKEKIEA